MKRTNTETTVFTLFATHYRAIVIGLCILLGMFIIFCSTGKNQQAEAATMNQKHYKCITIEEDDTLWTIAEENYSEEYDSYEDYIDEVRFINNLTDDTIYNGATLVVPYYSAPS